MALLPSGAIYAGAWHAFKLLQLFIRLTENLLC